MKYSTVLLALVGATAARHHHHHHSAPVAPVVFTQEGAWEEKNGNGKGFIPGGDLVVFEGYGPPRVLTSNGFGNPCANGIRSAEVLRGRVFFATSSWCNLSELAGSEFYEYIPELDTKNIQ